MSRVVGVAGGRPVRRLHGVLLVGPARSGWCAWEVDGTVIGGNVRFHHLGTDRVGEPGRRATVQRWSIPGTEDTAMTLSAAVRRWKRAVGLAIGCAFCFAVYPPCLTCAGSRAIAPFHDARCPHA